MSWDIISDVSESEQLPIARDPDAGMLSPKELAVSNSNRTFRHAIFKQLRDVLRICAAALHSRS